VKLQPDKRDNKVSNRDPKVTFKKQFKPGTCHKRQKPQAPIRNRQTRYVANAKGLNRNNLA